MSNSDPITILRKNCWVTLALAALVVLAGSACTGGDIGGTSDAQLVVDPAPPLVFAGGQTDYKSITIRNEGSDTLHLYEISIHNDDISAPFAKAEDSGPDWPQETELEPEEALTLTVEYDPPEGELHHSGHIALDNNDNSIDGDKIIALETDAADTELFVNPDPIDFPQTPAGSSDWQVVEIQNIGSGTIEIEDVAITSGDNHYSVAFFESRNSDGTFPSAADDVDSPPVTSLSATGEEVLYARVTFSPDVEEPLFGTLTITHDGGQTTDVPINGNSGDACLEVSDEDGLDFGPAALNDTTYHTMTLRNCSPEAELHLFEMSITDDGGGVFSIDDDNLPGALPDNDAVLEPGETKTALIGYHPTAETTHHGELLIQSDDSQQPRLHIPLSGEGVDAQCPVAIAEGSLPGAAPSNHIPATNQDVVQLSGSDSYDPDGTTLDYEWSVIERPPGSMADVEPSPYQPDPEFEVDIVGHFQLELTVYDEYGLSNCEPAILVIDATPQEDIHVQLVWSAPQVDAQGGPDPASQVGTDLDIHYVHQDSWWGDGDSVYWALPSQNWGNHGEATLDIDDLYGADPENINHADPAAGGIYRVGVHYYCDNLYGPADATVRIYFGTSLYLEEQRRLEATDHFWYVGNIIWDPANPTVDFMDNYQNQISDLTSCLG